MRSIFPRVHLLGMSLCLMVFTANPRSFSAFYSRLLNTKYRIRFYLEGNKDLTEA